MILKNETKYNPLKDRLVLRLFYKIFRNPYEYKIFIYEPPTEIVYLSLPDIKETEKQEIYFRFAEWYSLESLIVAGIGDVDTTLFEPFISQLGHFVTICIRGKPDEVPKARDYIIAKNYKKFGCMQYWVVFSFQGKLRAVDLINNIDVRGKVSSFGTV